MWSKKVSKSLQNLNNVNNKCLLFKTIEHAQAKLLEDYTFSFKKAFTFYPFHHLPFTTFTSQTSHHHQDPSSTKEQPTIVVVIHY